MVGLRALAATLAVLLPAPAAACRLALILALDVSSSVDTAENKLQRQGLAAALLSPEVEAAFFSGARPVALAAYEWSGGVSGRAPLLEWRLIREPADLRSAAEALAGSARGTIGMPTALGRAIGHAASVFARGPSCERRTLDISGDGRNNDGFPPEVAYRNFPLDGVTVNALAILGGGEGDLTAYFRNEVIRGPGAFVETAANYEDFERAMRRKLEREVGARLIGRSEGGR